MDNAIWGMAFVCSPIVILLIIITIAGFQSDSKKPQSELWVIRVIPLMFIVPFTVHFIGVKYFAPRAIFEGIVLAVFLYGFSILLIAFVGTLRKSRLPLIQGKGNKND